LRLRPAVWPVVDEGQDASCNGYSRFLRETYAGRLFVFLRASATATKRLRERSTVGSHLRVRRERIATGIRE